MFDINQYANGFTLIEATEINSMGRILREIAPIRHDQAMEPSQAPMFTQVEAMTMANALNAAAALRYTVTVDTQTTTEAEASNSYGANAQTSTIAWTFTGPGAESRAEECFKAEKARLEGRGKWPGYVTTIEMSAAIHSIACVEI
jgi:hypothetical protein